MAKGEVHMGDVGTVFIATITDQDGVVVDVSAASVKQILFRAPYGKVLTKNATLTTDGKDGKIQYTTVANDLDATGKWSRQGHVTIGAGEWKSDITQFDVYGNLG